MARRRSSRGPGALSTPSGVEPRRIRPPARDGGFTRFAEAFARYLGTARYLALQTVIIIAWIAFNELVHQFDAYPYILLTLALSMQASYAAPLILLAQSRQEERDREALERDREQARRTQQDTEYLARELAAIRIALADVATSEDIERAVERAVEQALEASKPTRAKKSSS